MSEGPGFAAFDQVCAEFDASLNKQAGTRFEVPDGGLDFPELGTVIMELDRSSTKIAPSNAMTRARQLLSMYRVMKAARGLVDDDTAAVYATKVHLLHIEYDKAAAAAMRSHDYTFSAALKKSASVLNDAYRRVKNNAAAMNLVASAMNGAAALIGALV
uniref:hypothetical protein n=1 Tax=Ensifer adhaerens TaxID=106592 RepID=UPI003F4966E7